MSTAVILPKIRRSPATLQYMVPYTRPAKFYEPRFVLDPKDRAKTLGATWFKKTDPMMPPYPYGPDVRYPEANEGLYGGTSIRSGNKISKGRNKGKTLRKWYPNVKVERIRSEALDRELTLPIAARVMRTIKKVGGLDQYVTGTRPARVKELGLVGWKLRWLVLKSDKQKAQYAEQRAAMNLPANPSDHPMHETFEQAWSDESRRQKYVQAVQEKWDQLREKDQRFKRHFSQNIVSDRSSMMIPNISTLSFYDADGLNLAGSEVQQVRSKRRDDPANTVV